MDMKQLEAFARVMENSSFSQTAREMGLSQPTVSAHIAALERELGLTLLVRTTKEIYPSDAGRLLFPYARDILEKRREAEEALRRFGSEVRGRVVVASSTIPAEHILPRLIPAFRQRYPDVEIDLQLSNSQDTVLQVAERQAELGFCGTNLHNGKCVFRELMEDRLVLITPNTAYYRRYQQGGFPVRQLMREAFISREKGSGTRKETELFLRAMGVDGTRLKLVTESGSNQEISLMVEQGRGVAVVSKSTAEELCRTGRLLSFDFDNVTLRRQLYLLRHKNSVLSPAAQAFYNFVEASFPQTKKEKRT